jgi:hypothetical protein
LSKGLTGLPNSSEFLSRACRIRLFEESLWGAHVKFYFTLICLLHKRKCLQRDYKKTKSKRCAKQRSESAVYI